MKKSLALALALFCPLAIAHEGDDDATCSHDHADTKASTAPKDVPGKPILRGEAVPAKTTVALLDLLKAPEKLSGKSVVVEGNVRKACTHRGCWMELAPSDQGPGLRVTFKDDGFFVPPDSAGSQARVIG